MSILRKDDRIRKATVIVTAVMVIVILLYALGKVLGMGIVLVGYTLISVSSSIACAVLCGVLWKHFRKGEVLKRIWGSLWFGLILWAAAEIIYGVYDVFLVDGTPYPSLADMFFVLGFIPIFIALFSRYNSLRVDPPRKLVRISGAAFGMVTALWLMFVIGPIIESPGAGTAVEQVLNILYPLGDLLVVMGALLSMLALVGGELSLPWGMIALCSLILAFSDSLYSYATWNNIYFPGGNSNLITALSNITHVAGYLVMAFGLYVRIRLHRSL
ncbi:MAG: hypothetical protein JXB30_03710 [Anaerolineae bacterium]|nr:hypothetical protein [Anaerolineae bacterium]